MPDNNKFNQSLMLLRQSSNNKKYILGGSLFFGFIFLFLFIIIQSHRVIINPGERGLIVNEGKLDDNILDAGVHWISPFNTTVKIFSLRIHKTDLESTARTKELQRIKTNIVVNWAIEPSKLKEIYLQIGNEGDMVDKVITPAVDEIIKASIPVRTLEQNLTEREQLKEEVKIKVKKRLSRYGIIIDDIAFVNLTASDEFNKATEERQIAQQQAITAQIIAEKELQEADFKALKAKKEAEEMINKAKGEAEAQKLLQQTLTQELLQKQAIEKWNGQYPTVMGNNGTLPILNIAPPVVEPSK
ncbi:Band 7 protein [Planktothrix sp. PCC 11201]|uniref:prohibitin family protein n=1 Tax=Planktothrix sp. PCC 11201 TaxID=1729650 RepID=UPI00090F61E2|nr:prohibitin family protein [Planktothrix sp. PCC 11201]SKB15108.1 Band 7 protein [Planktothrix sp. PCC 11201]